MVLPVRRLEASGERAWRTVERRGLESFVAKDPVSAYRSGPTRSWVKVKLRRTDASGRPSYGNATLPFGISAELVPTSLNCAAPTRV